MTARNAQREAEVLTALNKLGPCNAACLATAAGYRPAYVVRSLHALAKAGSVRLERRGMCVVWITREVA